MAIIASNDIYIIYKNTPIAYVNFWDKWWFNMVSEQEVLSSNHVFFIYFLFQLNISHVGHHFKKNLPLPTNLNFWNKW
jgi:hypothetical protein